MDIYAFCEDEEESCDSFSHTGKNSNHIDSTPNNSRNHTESHRDSYAFCDDEESSDYFSLPAKKLNRVLCSPIRMNHAVTVKKRKRSTSSILHEKKFDITKFYDLEAGCADKEDEHCSVESDNGELNDFINDNLEQVPTLSYYRQIKRRRRI